MQTAKPLYLDVVNALRGTAFENALVVGGRYGLGSKDTTPACIIAVYKNLDSAKPVNGFTVGIEDDVTHLSLPLEPAPSMTPRERFPASSGDWGRTVRSAPTRTP